VAFKAEELTTRIVASGGGRPCPDDTQRKDQGEDPCPDDTQIPGGEPPCPDDTQIPDAYPCPDDTQLTHPPTGDASAPARPYGSSSSGLAMLRQQMRERLAGEPVAARP
jgi:hypothetical protein